MSATKPAVRVQKDEGLATVRVVWEARDKIARERDLSPGRVLQDAAIIELMTAAEEQGSSAPPSPTAAG